MKFETKRLTSGKIQVKFTFTKGNYKGVYGYLCVESGTTLHNVVELIQIHFNQPDDFKKVRTVDYFTARSPIFIPQIA